MKLLFIHRDTKPKIATKSGAVIGFQLAISSCKRNFVQLAPFAEEGKPNNHAMSFRKGTE